MAEAAGSPDEQAHATVGFAQLAWLRGNHDHAAELMDRCLPILRRLADRRCTGRALYILGEHAHRQGQLPAPRNCSARAWTLSRSPANRSCS